MNISYLEYPMFFKIYIYEWMDTIMKKGPTGYVVDREELFYFISDKSCASSIGCKGITCFNEKSVVRPRIIYERYVSTKTNKYPMRASIFQRREYRLSDIYILL